MGDKKFILLWRILNDYHEGIYLEKAGFITQNQLEEDKKSICLVLCKYIFKYVSTLKTSILSFFFLILSF